MFLLKNPSKLLNSNQLSIKPVFYGMEGKNEDKNNIDKLKMNISTTKRIRINAQELQNAMDERPLTGQFSILVKKKLDSNSTVRYLNQGIINGAGAYASGMNLYSYNKAEKRIAAKVDKQERDEKKILYEDIKDKKNIITSKVI